MWRYASTGDGICILNAHQEGYFFCKSGLLNVDIPNRWPIDKRVLEREHELSMKAAAEHVDDVYLRHLPITSDFYLEDVTFYCCPVCGWWCIIQQIQYDTPHMPYMAFQWAAGTLVSQEFPDIDAPLSEVRSYLAAKYDQRFQIDPYRLEDVVASIFNSFKCEVQLSNRAHDGGIDIFGFDHQGKAFGIQVKRYRQKIGVEQLREFVGALALHGNLRGVFVSTSNFTSGAPKLRRQAQIAGIELQCWDALKLFDMLRVAQIQDFDPSHLTELAIAYSLSIPALNFGAPTHMNSL